MARVIRPPKPSIVGDNLAELAELVRRLKEAYAWAYNFGYSTGPVDAAPENAPGRSSDVSNPTLETATSITKERARGKTAWAAEQVADALSKLRGADTALAEAFPKDHEGYRPRPDVWPRTEKDAEIAERVAAQQRRTERGEGYGET